MNDRFHLGSSTKSMTATVAAALVHEGKTAWDTRLIDVYPASKRGGDGRGVRDGGELSDHMQSRL